MNQVTPRLEFSPERTYLRTGSIITCFRVLNITKDGSIIETPVDPIWKLELYVKEVAKALMEDLYYGEYTGA